MPISIASRRPDVRGLATVLRELVRRTLQAEGRQAGAIGVLLADDATLRGLNRQWRGLDRATDVLSFDYGEAAGDGSRAVTGDLAISMDRVAEQARRFRCSRGRELARLLIHGTLHLAGHDHQAAAERRRMRAREDSALRAVDAAVRRLERRLDAPRPKAP